MNKSKNDCEYFEGKFCTKGDCRTNETCIICILSIIERHLYDIKKNLRQNDKINNKFKSDAKTGR